MSEAGPPAVSIADVEAARAAVVSLVHHTPLLTSRTLGERIGARAHLKAESLQRTGSFKVRGATHAIGALAPAVRARGIVTMSAGNHAQAVAYAARAHGAPVIVAMPETAPLAKVDAAREYGAEIVFAPDTTRLMPLVEDLRAERGLHFLHPFDDPHVIAGQGTIGLEILDDLPEADLVVVPVGGGGLIAGIATAVAARRPRARVIGVEPVGAAAVRRALDAGSVVRLESVHTVADGLTAPFAGTLALPIIQSLVEDVVLVSDDEILEGLRFIAARARLLVEPAGAAAVGALLCGRVKPRAGERVVAVLSGGNVDLARAAALFAGR